MYGFFQTTFYFGYMALFSLALGIMCGKFTGIYPKRHRMVLLLPFFYLLRKQFKNVYCFWSKLVVVSFRNIWIYRHKLLCTKNIFHCEDRLETSFIYVGNLYSEVDGAEFRV